VGGGQDVRRFHWLFCGNKGAPGVGVAQGVLMAAAVLRSRCIVHVQSCTQVPDALTLQPSYTHWYALLPHAPNYPRTWKNLSMSNIGVSAGTCCLNNLSTM
jgi:hypothetical protein